jgi:transglutaminase-like putative cysteine protease
MLDRLLIATLRFLQPYWVSLVLFSGLLSITVTSINQANWVDQDAAALRSLGYGLLVGWMLARSRFSGLFVVLYALLFGLFSGIQAAGSIVPGLFTWFSQPILTTFNEINLRMLTFWLRFTGWMEIIQAGGAVRDTGLFILLLAILVWGLMVWLMWFMVRKRQALLAILPLGMGMAVNIHLSHQSLGYYWMFLFFSVLLVAHVTFIRQQSEWEHRKVDYSDQLGMDWSVSAVLVTILVMAIARGAPLVGTPEGWKLISEWVRSTNQQTSDTAERLFAGVNTPQPRPSGDEPLVLAGAPNLNNLGAPLPQGDQTVMWVQTSDPPPMLEQYGIPVPETDAKGHYWRNAIFSTYTGRGWEPAVLSEEEVLSQAPAEQPPAGRYYLRQQFEIVARHSGELFSVNEPVQVEEGIRLQRVQDGSLLLQGSPSAYAVISAATRASGNQLAEAGQEYPPAIRATYLQVTDNLPQRVSVLAARVAGSGTPFQQVLRVQDFLRENYPYDLDTPLAPEGRDVVDVFLFDQQKGFCSHYASAMVIMLRVQGIPARVVAGYATGNYDSNRSAYRVPEDAVHAWVEVYFPGIGWVEFEPTAARSVFVYSQSSPMAGEFQPAPALDPVGSGSMPLPVLLALVIGAALALLVAPFALLRLFSMRRALPAGQQAEGLYRQIRRALAWAGIRDGASVTPDEFLQRHSGQIAPYSLLLKALRQATGLYQQATFSNHPPEPAHVQSALALWRQSFSQWLKLWAEALRRENE